jgi:Methyltransferase domain
VPGGQIVETAPQASFYDDLADWWPLFSPPENYVEEAADLLERLGPLAPGPRTLLELGSGGGSLASHLKPHFNLTLTDRSPGMLAVNRAINPESEHLVGDMRSLRLGRQFDVVLVHDAIMYATDAASVLATLQTAAIHCRPVASSSFFPTLYGKHSHQVPMRVAMMAWTAEDFGTWSGVGIPIPPTTPTSSITRSCYERQVGQCGPYTIGTAKVFLLARGGWSGSLRPASRF